MSGMDICICSIWIYHYIYICKYTCIFVYIYMCVCAIVCIYHSWWYLHISSWSKNPLLGRHKVKKNSWLRFLPLPPAPKHWAGCWKAATTARQDGALHSSWAWTMLQADTPSISSILCLSFSVDWLPNFWEMTWKYGSYHLFARSQCVQTWFNIQDMSKNRREFWRCPVIGDAEIGTHPTGSA
jgi:hypothetical protein